jgi:hypothetical protein
MSYSYTTLPNLEHSDTFVEHLERLAPYDQTFGVHFDTKPNTWTMTCVITSNVLGKLSSPRQMDLHPNQGPVDLAGPT